MNAQPIPTAVHPDYRTPAATGRDAPVDDFLRFLANAGAAPGMLAEVRASW